MFVDDKMVCHMPSLVLDLLFSLARPLGAATEELLSPGTISRAIWRRAGR